MVFVNQVVHDGTRCSYPDPYSVCARSECVVSVSPTSGPSFSLERSTSPHPHPSTHSPHTGGSTLHLHLPRDVCLGSAARGCQPGGWWAGELRGAFSWRTLFFTLACWL